MNFSKLKIIFPQKSDYPKDFSILKKKTDANEYFQLLESSASAYFETDFFTRYLFMKRFKKALELIEMEDIPFINHFTDSLTSGCLRQPLGLLDSCKSNEERYRNGGSRKESLEILDAGCGIGFLLPTLSQIAKNIWAIDNAKHSLGYAKFMCQKRGIKNVRFKIVDLESPRPFTNNNNKFDLVICLSVLEHIKNPEKALSFFRSMLKREGSLIVGYPNEDNFIFKLFQTLEKKLFRQKVFKTLKGSKLVHVSKAHQISRVLERYFHTEASKNISIVPGISFYILKKCIPR